jgi:Excalibur calcium-binding domain
MNPKIQDVMNKATDFSGSPQRKISKGIIGAVIVVLLGALGLETTGSDFSIGSLLSGNSVSDSKIQRDEKGNLQQNAAGGFLTKKELRDKLGNIVPEGTAGAKQANEYNCDDFKSQPEAQGFFEKVGGVQADTNRLDGNKDGKACTALPVK